jgi:hypothetical protein
VQFIGCLLSGERFGIKIEVAERNVAVHEDLLDAGSAVVLGVSAGQLVNFLLSVTLSRSCGCNGKDGGLIIHAIERGVHSSSSFVKRTGCSINV